MTPQEAMRKAVASGLGLTAYDDPNPEEAAAAILAALPEGWELVDLPNFGKFILSEREYGARRERERLLRLCGRDRDCECPIHHDLRLRE